ncbi:hypothetical protein BJ165DRAFT_1402402 [Panaeolus papilionaceus]|nr:hypothetical protein BJ165DRAFT_1402402 [Panaeolus papilionaceus]
MTRASIQHEVSEHNAIAALLCLKPLVEISGISIRTSGRHIEFEVLLVKDAECPWAKRGTAGNTEPHVLGEDVGRGGMSLSALTKYYRGKGIGHLGLDRSRCPLGEKNDS